MTIFAPTATSPTRAGAARTDAVVVGEEPTPAWLTPSYRKEAFSSLCGRVARVSAEQPSRSGVEHSAAAGATTRLSLALRAPNTTPAAAPDTMRGTVPVIAAAAAAATSVTIATTGGSGGTSPIAALFNAEGGSTTGVVDFPCPVVNASCRPTEYGLVTGERSNSLEGMGGVAVTEAGGFCGGGHCNLARFAAGAASSAPAGTGAVHPDTAAFAGVGNGPTCVTGTADVATTFAEIIAVVLAWGGPASEFSRTEPCWWWWW